jgi:hypothetical protein
VVKDNETNIDEIANLSNTAKDLKKATIELAEKVIKAK